MNSDNSRSDKVSKRRRSTIDEADINGHLNTKKEALYKKMIWEILNKDYTTQKQQPKKTQKPPKPNNNNKKAAAASQVDMDAEEQKKKKKNLGSKVNFDALEKETGSDPEEEEKGTGKLGEVDETESCGGDGDYRHGFQEKNENNEDVDYGVYVYREDEEEEYGCDDNDEEY
ncbi:hypothetical protein Ddye_023233 [Dipteronia dyeriana]|uniref:Brf1 TBP-binding domain-containing protein n=1 Tax=Dipteronia dyeriana TaxID=168575 RepID=A0AAD9TTJ9_9ROSI|nr:hypothetical protein Ddye_023233 [Dipteronia dyeriana]